MFVPIIFDLFFMLKHASSHGLAVLVTTVASAFLVEILKPEFPEFINSVGVFSKHFVKLLHIPFKPETFTVILIASLLAMVWGIFFKLRMKQ